VIGLDTGTDAIARAGSDSSQVTAELWASGQQRLPEQDRALLARFPPRPDQAQWEATAWSREQVWQVVTAPPHARSGGLEHRRRRSLGLVLAWLEDQDGSSWQERWLASGAEADPAADWRRLALAHAGAVGVGTATAITMGLRTLIMADVIRPGLPWLLRTSTPKMLAAEMAASRDPDGFAALRARTEAAPVSHGGTQVALHRIAAIMAAKGGGVTDICVGDCLELLAEVAEVSISGNARSPYFYQLLKAAGMLEEEAPATIRMVRWEGQPTIEDLIDRNGIQCRPVRDLLVAYLAERQPALDFNTLSKIADVLGRLFWRDLEEHHPGIDSLRLDSEVATAWKQRMQLKRSRRGEGAAAEPRRWSVMPLVTVRAFYADIAQWAAEDPARWAQWVAPNPVKDADLSMRKLQAQRKSRMDERTRQRLQVMPALLTHVRRQRTLTAERLAAAAAVQPGQLFTAGGITMRRAPASPTPTLHLWALPVPENQQPGQTARPDDPPAAPASGPDPSPPGRGRVDLTAAEAEAFWIWAVVETLHETGIRIEELTEISHHSLISYQLPCDDGSPDPAATATTGTGIVPLLHIAPSKTDTERLMVISPLLADVLSAIVARISNPATGTVPLVQRYDPHERRFADTKAPLLFQRRFGVENRSISTAAIRVRLEAALTAAGITDVTGAPLSMQPHDFRRVFITDAISSGMPPHICQLIVGHADINVTLGYNAIYPRQVIAAHQQFITRRRTLRPQEEYRPVTDAEWDEFRGHFARRKVALGDCGRGYGTPCIHEHSCIRCPLLRPDPAQRQRLAELVLNLAVLIEEAEDRGWHGEAEGRRADLDAAKAKLAEMDAITASRTAAVDLGIPTFPATTARTLTQPGRPRTPAPDRTP